MLDQFARENMLDHKLSLMKPSQLAQLYLRVFNTDDGQMVLRDLENRCFVNVSTATSDNEIVNTLNEGMRAVYLSIVTRMKDTTQGGSNEIS